MIYAIIYCSTAKGKPLHICIPGGAIERQRNQFKPLGIAIPLSFVRTADLHMEHATKAV